MRPPHRLLHSIPARGYRWDAYPFHWWLCGRAAGLCAGEPRERLQTSSGSTNAPVEGDAYRRKTLRHAGSEDSVAPSRSDDQGLTDDDAPADDGAGSAPRKPRVARQASNQPKPADGSDGPVQICGKADTDVAPVIPDMLIVLDRSGSMMTPSRPGSPAVDRWNPSIKGVKTLTTTFDKAISFGLMVFPNESALCAPGDLRVPVAKTNAAKVNAASTACAPPPGDDHRETMQRALQSFGGRRPISLRGWSPRQPTFPHPLGNPSTRWRCSRTSSWP